MVPTIDPFAAIRRYLSDASSQQLDRFIIGATQSAADLARESVLQKVEELTSFLGSLPRWLADKAAAILRGPDARQLNRAEQGLVTEAFGRRVPPENVWVVVGRGRNAVAAGPSSRAIPP